ncbi:DUF6191 domain-containing protein [Streptomyces yaanensis]|uniref:DUF6191 domain-containing protein n=1 Tax=Streptomyces yaanensis TaxID=1142239 RepID=A0ABV7SER0_9ACTN
MFEELFAPGRKHTHEEKKRLELTRVDVTDGDPGRGPIDLASGTVVIRPPTPAPTERETGREAGGDTGREAGRVTGPEAEREVGGDTGPSVG